MTSPKSKIIEEDCELGLFKLWQRNISVSTLALIQANITMNTVKKSNPTNEEKASISKYMIYLFKEVQKLPDEDRIKLLRISFKDK